MAVIHNRCKDSTFKRLRDKYFFRHFIAISLTYVLNRFYVLQTHFIFMPLKYNYNTENYTRKFNLFWIPISFATVNPRETLTFVINWKGFIRFHIASHLWQRLDFFMRKNLSKKLRKLKMCAKVFCTIYTVKQRWAS